MTSRVAVARRPGACYPDAPPFHPGESFPELRTLFPSATALSSGSNPVYPLLRSCFHGLGLDSDRFGTPDWNPLAGIVPRGGRVVVKPNFVMHESGALRGAGCLITHASVIRAVLDYVALAGGPDCRIVVADSPLQLADFDAILHDSGLTEVLRFYRECSPVAVEALDLRRARVVVDDRRVIVERKELPGDPKGYAAVALGQASWLEPITTEKTRFAVTDYDRSEMSRHHGPGRHEYLISRTVLDCDAFINVPKLKTHQKVGVTLALKNLVGINGSKDWLPHYRPGPPESGGDEFPERNILSSTHSMVRSFLQGRSPTAMRVAQKLWHTYKRVFEGRGVGLSHADRAIGERTVSGAWHGNDTTWRMVLDLNQAILHAAADGSLGAGTRRAYLAIADGIVGGEGDGPLSPEPKPAGLLAASQDPVALDRVLAAMMGFDPSRIALLAEATRELSFPISLLTGGELPAVTIDPAGADWTEIDLAFRPAPGWRGKIERIAGGAPAAASTSH